MVDLWGVHYYDSGPLMNTQTRWDAAYTRTFNGGPWGLGTWLQAARQHGKKLAVSEWGVWQQAGQAAAAADDPVYVDNVFRFFGANAARRVRELLQQAERAPAVPEHAVPERGGEVPGRLGPGRDGREERASR